MAIANQHKLIEVDLPTGGSLSGVSGRSDQIMYLSGVSMEAKSIIV